MSIAIVNEDLMQRNLISNHRTLTLAISQNVCHSAYTDMYTWDRYVPHGSTSYLIMFISWLQVYIEITADTQWYCNTLLAWNRRNSKVGFNFSSMTRTQHSLKIVIYKQILSYIFNIYESNVTFDLMIPKCTRFISTSRYIHTHTHTHQVWSWSVKRFLRYRENKLFCIHNEPILIFLPVLKIFAQILISCLSLFHGTKWQQFGGMDFGEQVPLNPTIKIVHWWEFGPLRLQVIMCHVTFDIKNQILIVL